MTLLEKLFLIIKVIKILLKTKITLINNIRKAIVFIEICNTFCQLTIENKYVRAGIGRQSGLKIQWDLFRGGSSPFEATINRLLI